jgi:hypothetical protein
MPPKGNTGLPGGPSVLGLYHCVWSYLAENVEHQLYGNGSRSAKRYRIHSNSKRDHGRCVFNEVAYTSGSLFSFLTLLFYPSLV